MDNKQRYIEFAQREKNLPIFIQPWWLDAVTRGQWDVALVEKGGEIVAAWPYQLQKKMFFRLSLMPPMTQRMGVYIKYPQGQKYYRRLAYEKEMIFALYEQLPRFHAFTQNLDYRYTNMLPFYWLGFETRVRYTYVIESQTVEQVYDSLEQKRKVKKAQSSGLVVKHVDDMRIIYNLVSNTFERKGSKFPYDFSLLQQLDQELVRRNRRVILTAQDNVHNTVAALYLVWDDRSMYYILGGFEPSYNQTYASTLLMWQAIKMAMGMGLDFDFEGSMNQGIERFFRGFGAQQRQIFNIYYIDSKALCLMRCLLPKVRRII